MRIAGYIEHPRLKITIFQMDNRFSVKLETGIHEQTYKIRTGGAIETLADVKKWVDAPFITQVEQEFKYMHKIQMEALARLKSTSKADDFPDII
ncbi:MAG: hypothetical protein HRU40_06725 [Saprospiraceae bacterium]|nr:hypothetical protein [Saprospiraceae bacterium]